MKHEMKNIVINMNSAYFPYSLVMLQSLFVNNSDFCFCIYLLYSDMQPWELDDLGRFVQNFQGSLEPVKVDKRVFQNFPLNTRWSVETYYRLLIPQLLPQDVSYVLYLDIDLVIDGNIRELLCLDLDRYYLAACEDVYENIDCQNLNRKWSRPDGTRYFNAGVMALNLSGIRKKIQPGEYAKAVEVMHGDLPYMDQDILNYLLGEKVKYLEPEYNCVCGIHTEKMRKGIICHYGTPDKPWSTQREIAFLDIWHKYKDQVADYDKILEKVMKEK